MKLKGLTLYLVVHCLIMQASAQPFRYTVRFFNEIDTLKNIEYANAPWLSNPIALLADYNIHEGEATTEDRPLLMDIFIPKNDTLQKRPAIVFMHGGAFLLGSRFNEDMVAMCDSFARRGYVTATIDYRLGIGADVSRIFGVISGIRVNESNARRAVFRATQDSRAAIRFLKHNSEIYNIDTTRIFIIGSSAGAISTLNNIYMGNDQIPSAANQSPVLGNLDSIGIQGYDGSADLAVALWGAVENISIIGNNQTPLFLIHGEDDNVVPFRKGIPLEGNIPPNPFVAFNMPETFGSFCIDTFLTNRGIPHETWFVENKGHEFYGVNTGKFNDGGPNEYWDSTMMKTSKFLFEQIKPVANFDFEITENVLTLANFSTASDSVLWNFGDGTTSKDWAPTHIYEMEGTYKISLTICNNILACNTVSKEVNYSATQSVNAVPKQVKIFPNPVSSQLKIKGINTPFNVRIRDLTGQLQFSQNGFTENQLNVNQLVQGVYILEIQAGEVSFFKKFVKVP